MILVRHLILASEMFVLICSFDLLDQMRVCLRTASRCRTGISNGNFDVALTVLALQTPSTNSHTSYMNMWSDAAAGTNSGSWGHNRPLAYVMRHAEFTTSTDPDPSRSGYASARNVDGARCGQAGDPSSHLGAGSGLRSLSEWVGRA